MNKIDKQISSSLANINNNTYIAMIIYIILLCYIGCYVYKIPHKSASFFNNIYVKLILLILSAYLIHKDVPLGLLFSMAVLATIHVSWKRVNKMNNKHKLKKVKQETSHMEQPIVQENMGSVMMKEESMELNPESLTEIKGEMPQESCTMTANYHNSFYPQYVNMKPDAYMARYTSDSVGGYDSTAAYSKL
jgi:hypothetical protein